MKGFYVFLCAAMLAAVAPWLRSQAHPANERDIAAFPGWPAEWEGKPLSRLTLSERETRFAVGFRGRVAQFTDGRRQLVLRWVNRETRQLHPAADCFRGSGYAIRPAPLRTDSRAARWGCFHARRDDESLWVRERIYDQSGSSWTDVSSWYWAAALGKTAAPWWAVTIVERDDVAASSASEALKSLRSQSR